MKIVEFVPPVPHPLWKLCLQMGIPDVIVKVNPSLTGRADPWRFETLRAIVGRLADAGLRVVGLEGDPFDMAPIKQFGEQIRRVVDDTLRAMNVQQGLIIIEDKGALDCVIRARLQSALLRAADEQAIHWEALK